ncbi:PEP-CTERM sorting domain-containing protein [Pelomonas sp. Root1237]|uniref:PEP-CTERM sorting domain-containing protein n=1 Tax=Pelomonas sp. Root1237 TaxID=1736434 RepID=UPI0006FA9FFC|nr:PEP-CTERM sorting domain-containing protein [Pelomonas sp. Root1237]KQV85679.1 hypothetical protein ASC91_23900 [Pelomonas sp. Root1237]
MKIRTLLTALALFASGAAWGQAGLATASGTARGDFQIGCSTCPHFQLGLTGNPVQSQSGPLAAQVDYLGQPVGDPNTAGYSLGGGVEYHASAALQGALATPLLGAYARADNEPVVILADPAQLEIGIDLYAASAVARTQQTYHYLGASTTTYHFDFQVDGTLSSTRASAFGSAAIYTGQDPSFEVGLIDFGYSSHSGVGLLYNPQAFGGDFSVSITVDPGASFVLISQLSASVQMTYDTTDVLADASHTLRLTAITGGDPGLLVTAVPEPSTALLLSLGLIALLRLRRERR